MSSLSRACRVAAYSSPLLHRGLITTSRVARGGMGSGFGTVIIIITQLHCYLHLGTSYAHDPKWIEDWMARKRVGVDRMGGLFLPVSHRPHIISLQIGFSEPLIVYVSTSYSSSQLRGEFATLSCCILPV